MWDNLNYYYLLLKLREVSYWLEIKSNGWTTDRASSDSGEYFYYYLYHEIQNYDNQLVCPGRPNFLSQYEKEC